METKIRSICVDTLTAIQTNEYMMDQRAITLDKWKDYGKSIYNFNSDLQKLDFELIMILGEPGTGKSSGMMTLPSHTNVWYNADEKNPVWIGGKKEYGTKHKPIAPYHVIPKSYKDIINHIKMGLDKGLFEEDRFAFITGHVETYKAANDVKERLKTLGSLATKMQLEGKMETVFYSKVEVEDGIPQYFLETQNSGFNTARSPMGVFDTRISNDYKLVIDKLIEAS